MMNFFIELDHMREMYFLFYKAAYFPLRIQRM